MDGNRGAKGSIKDRLISMLYRLRYQRKKLKEEDYKIENKQKQVDYLNILQEFDEKENLEILDSKDRDELEKVDVTATYKISKSNGIGGTELNKINSEDVDIGLDNVDIKLSDVELKSVELDQKVEIKKEIKKTKNEIEILKEVDDFIKKSKESLDELKNEVDELKEESKKKNKDTKELEEKYEKLKEKVTKLKQQFDAVQDKYDLSEFSILESIKLIDNIIEYKPIATLNEMDMMIKVCKKEFDKIEDIKIIYDDQNKVGDNIEETKEIQKEIKIKFIRSKEKVTELNNIEDKIRYELKIQQEIIDEMYAKASFFKKEIVKKTQIVGQGKFLSSMLRIAGGVLTLPLTGINLFRRSLGTTLINRGLRDLNKSFETKEKIEFKYDYEDISKQISEVKDQVQYTNLMLIDSLNEIKKLRQNFNNVYSEYKKILPDYLDTLNNLNNLESKLMKEQIKISKMNNKLDVENEINKQKLKRIGE